MTEGESVRTQRGGLWRDSDFLRFWSAETLSLLGAQISLVAIPLLAVTKLSATPVQMGVLNAAQFLPFLLLTLIAGVWVDQRRRRPLLIGANFGRALLYGLIPLFAAMQLLNIGVLSTLVFLAGMLTVVFDLAYQSYLPSLVGNEHLIEGNSKVEGSRSFAQLSGPGAAGVMVGAIGAATAVLINAVTYLVSAVTMLFIRRPEPVPQPDSGPRASLWVQIGRGLRLTVSNKYLRPLGIEAACYNLFNQMLWAVLILYLSRALHFSPLTIGLILTMEGVGALLGSLVAARLSRQYGLGRTVVWSIVVANLAPLLIPAAVNGSAFSAALIGVALMINGAGIVIYGIQAISVRQAAVTSDVLGRTNAGYRFAVTGTAAIGALLGGVVGGLVGLRPTMVIGALGTLGAMWVVFLSPIPGLRVLSDVGPTSGLVAAVPDQTPAG
ncbi:MAG: MFS transporter [Micromonosporaceae bacterium]